MCEKSESTTCEQLTLFAEDSPVSPSRVPANAKARKTNAGFGPSSPVLFASLDPDGSWVKMCRDSCQLMLDGRSEPFCETWPRAGMMQRGKSFQQPALVLYTCGREFFSWVWIQTPRASGSIPSVMFGASGPFNRLPTIEEVARELGGKPNPMWVEWIMGFPKDRTDLEA